MYTRYVQYSDYASVENAVRETEQVECQDHGNDIICLFGDPKVVDSIIEKFSLSDASPFVSPQLETLQEQPPSGAPDPLGRDLLRVLQKRRNGGFPKNISMSELKSALKELQRDTSDYVTRIATKSLAFVGVVVAGAAATAESVEVDTDLVAQADRLLAGAAAGLSVKDILATTVMEKEKARIAAEKMAKNTGKKPGDDGWDALVKKFEDNFGKVGKNSKKESLDEGQYAFPVSGNPGAWGVIVKWENGEYEGFAAYGDSNLPADQIAFAAEEKSWQKADRKARDLRMKYEPVDDPNELGVVRSDRSIWKQTQKDWDLSLRMRESFDEAVLIEASALGSLEQALVKAREILNKAVNKVAGDSKLDARDLTGQIEAIRALMIDALTATRHQAKIDKM